jgi:multiple sugar transport system substrate-binding protein
MTQIDQEIWDEDGSPAFSTSKAVEFGDFLAELRDVRGLSGNVVSDTYQTVTDGLNSGTVALSVIGTERVVSIAAVNPDVKWTSLPVASTGDETGSAFGWTLGVGAGSENADAAWRFIEYMTGPDAAARMAAGGEVPTRASAYEHEYFSSPDAEAVNAIAEYVENNSRPRQYAENYLSLAAGLSQAGQSLILDNITGEEYIDSAFTAAVK